MVGIEGPNRTVDRIRTESSLVVTFHTVKRMIDENLDLCPEGTIAHIYPGMTTTYAALGAHMDKQ